MDYLNQIREAGDFLHDKGFHQPAAGIVLGTGLNKLLDHMDIAVSIDYTDIPHFVQSTVSFHKGKLLYGRIGNITVIAMQGRFHYYEGYSMQQITFPIRVIQALGIQHLFLSNAAGGINASYKKGDLILVDDHINLQVESPLRGLNHMDYGGMFPDMSCPYDPALQGILTEEAGKLGIDLQKGVYAAVCGPNLETRAEYRYLHTIGADLVGMSTVPEVIVANQLKVPCAVISVVTDECDPDNLHPVDIAEIIAVAEAADEQLSRLLSAAIARLPQNGTSAIPS